MQVDVPMARASNSINLDESYMVIPAQPALVEHLNASNGSTNQSLVRQNAVDQSSPQLNRTAERDNQVSPGPNVQRMIDALTERMNSMERSFNAKK